MNGLKLFFSQLKIHNAKHVPPESHAVLDTCISTVARHFYVYGIRKSV